MAATDSELICSDEDLAVHDSPDELLALDEALTKWRWRTRRQRQLVKLRFFTGLSIEQAAEVLGCSRATAYRHWSYARAGSAARCAGNDTIRAANLTQSLSDFVRQIRRGCRMIDVSDRLRTLQGEAAVMVDPNHAKSIFLAAIEKPPAERAAFLDQAAGGRRRTPRAGRGLARGPRRSGQLSGPAGRRSSARRSITLLPSHRWPSAPARVIGPYKLLEQIGEGGMGVVYMADQQTPVRRRVALKIIKPGMDTRQVIARFEAERQALALMDHPNIARVLDAGATDSGRPVLRDGTGPRHPDHRVLRPEQPARPRAAGTVRPGLPGRAARAPEGDHPPRHQAVERAGHAARRPAGAQGDRFRRRQGDQPAADREDAVHGLRRR